MKKKQIDLVFFLIFTTSSLFFVSSCTINLGNGSAGSTANSGGGTTVTIPTGPNAVVTNMINPSYQGYYFLANTADELAYTSYPGYSSYPNYSSYPVAQTDAATAAMVSRSSQVCQFLGYTGLSLAASFNIPGSQLSLNSITSPTTNTIQSYSVESGVHPTYLSELSCSK